MADSDGGGDGAERNVVLCILHPETSEEKKTIGREGTTTIIQEDARKAEIPIAIAKVNLGMSPACRVVWGSVPTGLNLVGCQSQYTI
jgi:hypothetical protein